MRRSLFDRYRPGPNAYTIRVPGLLPDRVQSVLAGVGVAIAIAALLGFVGLLVYQAWRLIP